MSNETQTEPVVPIHNEKPEYRDWFLAFLVSLVNRNPVNFDVTLTVGGTLISGLLISRQDYFDKLASQVNEVMRRQLGEDITDGLGLQQVADVIRSKDAQDTEAGVDTPIGYIHLDAARIFAPTGTPIPQEGMLWRGRLDAVEGFTVGHLATS